MIATCERVLRPDQDSDDPEEVAYGGGPSFDLVIRSPDLDFVFESRNVGRHDGHFANLVVLRNATGLPWVDGWSEGDAALEAMMKALIEERCSTLR